MSVAVLIFAQGRNFSLQVFQAGFPISHHIIRPLRQLPVSEYSTEERRNVIYESVNHEVVRSDLPKF
jgi:hypothetical protein